MWLLRLHFAVSVLCFITFVGFLKVFKEQIRSNGWFNNDDKKKSFIRLIWAFFIPILNILLVVVLFTMICTAKEDSDKRSEDHKKEKESRQ